MAGRRKENEAGSSNKLRGDVLRVLGVLKVATADQIQRICSPHLTYRHTDKDTPSERKTARTASHGGALSDLRAHGLAEDGGKTSTGETLRNLTAKGLEAAAYALGRPEREMGSAARGAGATGAAHPMSVNETVIALLRPKPDLALLTDEPAEARAAAQAAVEAPAGVGTIDSFATEVVLPFAGTWTTPGRAAVHADIVLTAPEDGIPLLFIEVDNCHESPQKIAAKFHGYQRFFQRTVKDTDGHQRPMWRTRWWTPEHWHGDEEPHPPVLLVFNRIGKRNPDLVMRKVAELTSHIWQGQAHRAGHHTYDGSIPIVATGLNLLREHGPAGLAFQRIGRPDFQSLTDAIGNPRREAAVARARAAEARAEAQRTAGREARRPSCADCEVAFTDERWHESELTGWGKDDYPHLCAACKRQAVTADELEHEQQRAREVDSEEARALEELHRQADQEAEAHRKARRFPFPWRPHP
ncbi:replication-relaxation family protein [Streptomyces sp. NPDC058665]|uniref:replication-relaxation family protein n=1 Tax=Streptomyces sp. NPDC058665 TaxID=3346586 RepID=UPI0036655F8A